MTTPNQQPEVSAEAREAAGRISGYLVLGMHHSTNDAQAAMGNEVQRAIDRATEKLREQRDFECLRGAACLTAAEGTPHERMKGGDYAWSLAYEKTMALLDERDQLRAELSSTKKENEILSDICVKKHLVIESSHKEAEALRAENEALRKEGDETRNEREKLRTALIACFKHFGKEIERFPLNESAANGTQIMSAMCAKVLDETDAAMAKGEAKK